MSFPANWREIVEKAVYENRGTDRHWGFHDDHRENDHPDRYHRYKPALQQVKAEYLELLETLDAGGCGAGRALQLGIGMSNHSHWILNHLFKGGAVTIDINCMIAATGSSYPGARTDTGVAINFARERGPYSFILVDAGHSFAEVSHDSLMYWPMLLSGGIMAFHDALEREGYPEIGVPEFVKRTFVASRVNIIGTEVGFAWILKP